MNYRETTVVESGHCSIAVGVDNVMRIVKML
jgi:hypothetical protein